MSERTRISLAMDERLRDQAEKRAKRAGWTLSQLVRRAVAEYLGRPKLGEMPAAHRPKRNS